MIDKRQSGVLLHPTSLPGAYGMGELGSEARKWIDQMVFAGQSLWQVLPFGPTGYGDSPYQSLSTFAGNDLLISFDDLIAEGLLKPNQVGDFSNFPTDHVDYGGVIPARRMVLDSVCRTFKRRASAELFAEFENFCSKQASWLDDYAIFSALKTSFDLRPWTEWDEGLRKRDPKALAKATKKHATGIRNVKILQFLFDRQWHALRKYANDAGIGLVGDIPIFVAHDSSDVWSNPDLYYLDDDGQPTVIAGVPPDYFSVTGQRWGNPLYRWDLHKELDYAWWTERMQRLAELVDVVRIDHFRGFDQYWEIPATEETAINGQWVDGPGTDLFDAILPRMEGLSIIAEDLGLITDSVEALRDHYNFPGMRIMQFSFADDLKPEFKPDGFPENSVVYSGTHDNDTTVGWFSSSAEDGFVADTDALARERAAVLACTGTDGGEIHWDIIALGAKSAARISVTPLQDIMGLGSEARMNVPGNPGGNWQWRFTWGRLSSADLQRFKDVTEWSGRLKS